MNLHVFCWSGGLRVSCSVFRPPGEGVFWWSAVCDHPLGWCRPDHRPLTTLVVRSEISSVRPSRSPRCLAICRSRFCRGPKRRVVLAPSAPTKRAVRNCPARAREVLGLGLTSTCPRSNPLRARDEVRARRSAHSPWPGSMARSGRVNSTRSFLRSSGFGNK